MWLQRSSVVESISVHWAVMKLVVTVQKSVYLWCFLSIAVLHSVSAGGAYCAKTARARAAALGLDYPGVHGAPDLSAPVHHVMHPRTSSPGPADPNMDSHGYNQPREGSFDMTYKQVHPRSSLRRHSTSVPHGYNGFPRGPSVRTPESGFEEVKHVAPSRFGAMTLNPRSHTNSPPLVYSEHDLDVDESAPNRRGVPQSWAGSARGPTRSSQARPGPSFHPSRLLSKGDGKTGAPWYSRRKMTRLPGQQPKLLNAKQFVPGRNILRQQRKRPDFRVLSTRA